MKKSKEFKPVTFINRQIQEIKHLLRDNKALIACSGGVDSTTCALLTYRAVGKNLICIFIDTNFMRLGEPKQVVQYLSNPPLNLPIKLVHTREKFMTALQGLVDAEVKRKAFRNTFYSILSSYTRKEGCHYLVQGTILPDVLETVGGIKTQHNVLEQMNIDTEKLYGFKVLEPLVSLYKYQVREVAKSLGVPIETYKRQPFPGPGLSVRIVGRITAEKLRLIKIATRIVEKNLNGWKSNQYFPAIIENIEQRYSGALEIRNALMNIIKKESVKIYVKKLKSKATGIKAEQRLYGSIVLVDVYDKNQCMKQGLKVFNKIQKKIIDLDGAISRVLYRLTDDDRKGKWIIAIRAVETHDFVRARVSNLSWNLLRDTSREIMSSCPKVSATYYDITPKPPSSIEYE